MARLGAEAIELRYRARRYDEIKGQLAAWQAKASRCDQLISELGTIKKRHLAALFLLGQWELLRLVPDEALRSIGVRIPAAPAIAGPPRQPDADKLGRVCILSHADLRAGTRAADMAQALSDAGHAVTVVCRHAPERRSGERLPPPEYLSVAPETAQVLRRAPVDAFAAAADRATRHRRFDLVQAHGTDALAAAARLAGRDHARLVCDIEWRPSHRARPDRGWLAILGEWCGRRALRAILRNADLTIADGDGPERRWPGKSRTDRPLVIRDYGRVRQDAMAAAQEMCWEAESIAYLAAIRAVMSGSGGA